MSNAATSITQSTRFQWVVGDHALEFAFGDDAAVALASVDGHEVHRVPFVQVLSAGSGHEPASDRLVGTRIGASMRHVSHRIRTEQATRSRPAAEILEIVQSDGAISATARLAAFGGGLRATVTIRNSAEVPLVLRSIVSWAAGLPLAVPGADALADWNLVAGRSD